MAVQTKSPKNHAPESQSRPIALVLTLLLWVAALSVVILLPSDLEDQPAKPVYQSLSLTLAPLGGISQPPSAGQETPTESVIPSTEATVEVSGGASVSKERVAQETVPATAPAVSPPHDKKPVDPDSFDQAAWESLFAGNSTQYSNSIRQGSQSAALDTISSLSGVAATAANASSSEVSSDIATGKGGSSSPADDTTKSLGDIARAAAGETTGTGATSTGSSPAGKAGGTSASSPDEAGGMSLELVGGGRRRLLEPAEPVILISRENQRLIPGSLEVTITFGITPEGMVLPGSIKITPESLVHNQVQEEIKTQIGKWRFQVAEGSGQVRFKYNIMKK